METAKSNRSALMAVLLPLLVIVVFTQHLLDPTVADIHKNERTAFYGLSNEFVLGPALGLQEAVAGILWIRADEFFHEGDYDAILPIVRMVTWLDPHQLDVYITGAWHLAYNFTDSEERSDRRYVPAAQKLLEEGDSNNPTVFDVAFEIGWQSSDKMKNYERAETWFRLASQRRGTDMAGIPNGPAPQYVLHQLAHAYEHEGKVKQCIAVWRESLAKSELRLKDPKQAADYSARAVRDSEMHNLVMTLKRSFSRYTHELDWDVDEKQSKSIDMQTGAPIPDNAYIATRPSDGVPIGTPRLPATARPWDTAFNAHVSFPQPRIMQPSGVFNVGDGARVTILLHDDDWREKQLKEFSFNIDQSQTLMVDQHSVRDGRWGRRIDMSRDPKMYSFTRPFYYLVFEFDPRGSSPFIQDKFGWSGEGITDPKYLWVDKTRTPNVRILRKVFKISLDQIMGNKPVTDNDVISNAQYALKVGQGGAQLP